MQRTHGLAQDIELQVGRPRSLERQVLLAPLLWLGWPCAAPPPPLLGMLRHIPFRVGCTTS